MIDWNRLEDLRTDIGEEDFADVVHLFVSEMTEHLDRVASNPQAATAADFHFLRGSAANMGFIAMADACRNAEMACLSCTPPDLSAISDRFTRSLGAIAPRIPGAVSAA